MAKQKQAVRFITKWFEFILLRIQMFFESAWDLALDIPGTINRPMAALAD